MIHYCKNNYQNREKDLKNKENKYIQENCLFPQNNSKNNNVNHKKRVINPKGGTNGHSSNNFNMKNNQKNHIKNRDLVKNNLKKTAFIVNSIIKFLKSHQNLH